MGRKILKLVLWVALGLMLVAVWRYSYHLYQQDTLQMDRYADKPIN
jgi:hypothetical protein